MKKILLLFICCLCLSGCNKINIEKEDYSKKVLICTINEDLKNSTVEREYKLYFTQEGNINLIKYEYIFLFDDDSSALNYYRQLLGKSNNNASIDGKYVTSEGSRTDFSGFGENRGTFDKEKTYWENQGLDCQVKDTDE